MVGSFFDFFSHASGFIIDGECSVCIYIVFFLNRNDKIRKGGGGGGGGGWGGGGDGVRGWGDGSIR